MSEKNLYIIAGCNGAGKTTASFTILPEILDCKEFVNADEIAKGLSPFQPDKVSFESGRIMLNRIDELLSVGENFAFETTLSTRTYRDKVLEAKSKGYFISILFFWLRDVELAKERVKTRVKEGGHSIAEDVIERRYERGIINLFELFLPIVDAVMIFDNSEGQSILIAEKLKEQNITVLDKLRFAQLNEYYESKKYSR